jgi:hypothetical protein
MSSGKIGRYNGKKSRSCKGIKVLDRSLVRGATKIVAEQRRNSY